MSFSCAFYKKLEKDYLIVRIVNDGLGFILFSFAFILFFSFFSILFLVLFYFSLFWTEMKDVMWWSHKSQSMTEVWQLSQSQSHNYATQKKTEDSRIRWYYTVWQQHYYDQCLLDTAWTRVKGNDNMIGCAKVISVSASYSRCSILTWSSLFYDLFDLCTMNNSLMLVTYI